jgi:hypothetical protein
LSKKFVLLWDEEGKRGWLVNGTSALVHLLRQSLEHDSTDKFKSEFLFQRADLQETSDPYKAYSAIDVLLNRSNKRLELYPEKNDFIRLEDRVEQICELIEKLIDYQYIDVGHDGDGFRNVPRKYLEGWDFNDLATDRDPFYPRVTTLHVAAKCWVNFIRSIHAVTLFGRGFGDILLPDDIGLCTYWARLPKMRYYIAAGVSDLRDLMDLEGDQTANPMRLSEDIVWYHPDGASDPCKCAWKGFNHSDLTQVLLPSSFGRNLPEKIPMRLEPNGAVIFSYNANFNWLWEDTGGPQEGDPPSTYRASCPIFNLKHLLPRATW